MAGAAQYCSTSGHAIEARGTADKRTHSNLSSLPIHIRRLRLQLLYQKVPRLCCGPAEPRRESGHNYQSLYNHHTGRQASWRAHKLGVTCKVTESERQETTLRRNYARVQQSQRWKEPEEPLSTYADGQRLQNVHKIRWESWVVGNIPASQADPKLLINTGLCKVY